MNNSSKELGSEELPITTVDEMQKALNQQKNGNCPVEDSIITEMLK